MLDRLISGAGAVTDTADRVVRVIGRGGGEGLLGRHPGSVVVAAICVVLAGILVFAGIEATDNPTALTMTPDQVAKAEDLGSRAYATISGSIAATYVETYTDDNANGSQEAGETGTSWYYFLVDPADQVWRHHPEPTPPKELFTFEASGRRDGGRELPQAGRRALHRGGDVPVVRPGSKQVHRCHRIGQRDEPDPRSRRSGIPAPMTPVRVVGSKAGGYLETCSERLQRQWRLPGRGGRPLGCRRLRPGERCGRHRARRREPRVHAGDVHRDAPPR